MISPQTFTMIPLELRKNSRLITIFIHNIRIRKKADVPFRPKNGLIAVHTQDCSVDGAFLWNADEQLICSYYFLPGAIQTQDTEHGGEQA